MPIVHMSRDLLHAVPVHPTFYCWLSQHQDSQSEFHSEDSLITGSEELRRAWINLQRVERQGEISRRFVRGFMAWMTSGLAMLQ